MQKITPFLWYDSQAEEAANFYVSLLPNSKIVNTVPYATDTPSNKPIGSVMMVEFELAGQRFTALNGGPMFKFTEAVSFAIHCETQVEVDELWTKMSADPQAERCGWLKDKFGLSWQIVPDELGALLSDPDPAKAQRVMAAMLQMKKIDIPELKRVRDQA